MKRPRPMKRPRRPALLTLAILALGACARPEPPVSVLWITIDTTSADRIGAYGSPSARTPTLDALAARGTLYARAYAAVPETLPSHATMFTGLYPPSHGVRLNLSFRLPDEAETLAEILAARGYRTSAVVAAPVLDRRYGLDQGFDSYDDLRRAERRERSAQEVTALALESLDSPSSPNSVNPGDTRPFFLWAHYYDPHSPFEPRPPFTAPADLAPESAERHDLEIAYTDRWIGELLAGLERRDLTERTLIVLAADHGESLGEHGETYHTLFVYDATIHVPLIVAGPGVERGRRVDEIVSLVDVRDSVLAHLGLRRGGGRLPGLSGYEATTSRFAYSESMTPPLRYGWRDLRALRSREWLYIRAPVEELYRLDGGEADEVNLIFGERRALAEMRRALDAELERMPRAGWAQAAGRRPSDEERRRLEALGYLEGDGDSGTADPAKDPKDLVEVAEAYELSRLARRLGRPETALELLAWAAGADPENFGVWLSLGQTRRESGDFEGAAAALDRALDLRPTSWQALTELAATEVGRGRTDRAERHLLTALESSPFPVDLWRRLGALRLAAEDWVGAGEAFRRVAELAPGDPRATAALERLGREGLLGPTR